MHGLGFVKQNVFQEFANFWNWFRNPVAENSRIISTSMLPCKRRRFVAPLPLLSMFAHCADYLAQGLVKRCWLHRFEDKDCSRTGASSAVPRALLGIKQPQKWSPLSCFLQLFSLDDFGVCACYVLKVGHSFWTIGIDIVKHSNRNLQNTQDVKIELGMQSNPKFSEML